MESHLWKSWQKKWWSKDATFRSILGSWFYPFCHDFHKCISMLKKFKHLKNFLFLANNQRGELDPLFCHATFCCFFRYATQIQSVWLLFVDPFGIRAKSIWARAQIRTFATVTVTTCCCGNAFLEVCFFIDLQNVYLLFSQ